MQNFSPVLVDGVIVFTDNPELAARAAKIIADAHLPSSMPDGMIEVEGQRISWACETALRRYDAWQ